MLYVFHYKNDTNNNRLGRDAKVEQIQIQKKMMMTGQSELTRSKDHNYIGSSLYPSSLLVITPFFARILSN